ncbi:MAG TPA: tetratricopeptide repeat protein [Xanthobacteraceae bacterium]|nr:tetratricopeptide repeat protein [Xanthobacteraceae bacterium]
MVPAAAAQKTEISALERPTPLTQQQLARLSPSGSYLAARHAGMQRDNAAAAAYYRAALKADPHNPELLERTFLSLVLDGEVDEAAKLAERVIQVDRTHRIARLVLGVRGIKTRHYGSARQHLALSVRGPIADLTATLLIGWAELGAGDSRGAVDAIDKLTGPDWYAIFKDLHTGLILDLAGKRREAGKRLEAAYKRDSNALRAVEAYGRWAARQGKKEEALAVFEKFDKLLPRHPLIVEEMDSLKKGGKLPPLVDSAQAGAAEVLYGLGASLGRQGGEDLSILYLQLALYLQPKHGLALLSLADLYENLKKPELAIRTYEQVPQDSPLRRNAEIQLSVNYDAIERTDEAKNRLRALVETHPDDVEAIMALGNILRARKEFHACGDVYSKAIATIDQPEKAHWLVFYFRGICYERDKQWAKAEADLKKALELYPDQPHVLNYLGYSWIDQGVNLEEGMQMIRKAVEQRPDDGYIVDSLGWAYYRIGDYEEAVKHLERAVELKPEDPTINDHLGDVYWRIGRTLEARFQWSHARDLKPEPDDLKKIEAKLKHGLTDGEPTSAAQAEKEKPAEPAPPAKSDNGG